MYRATACALCLLSLSSSAIAAQDDDETNSARRRFLTEYPKAIKKLKGYYTNLRLVVKQTNDKGDTTTWEFRANGDSLLWIHENESETADTRAGRSSALVADPDLSFKAARTSSAGRYTLLKMADHPAPETYRGYRTSILARSVPAFAPYSLGRTSIWESLSRPEIKLQRVQEVDGPEGPLIQVDWRKQQTPGKSGVRGRYTFDPGAGWIVRSYEFIEENVKFRTKNGEVVGEGGEYGELEYSVGADGIPVIQKMQTWTSGTGGKFPQYTYEVVELEPGPVPKEEFTLEAFGIHTDPAPDPVPVMYYLLALSFACILAAAVFGYLRRRSERAAATA